MTKWAFVTVLFYITVVVLVFVPVVGWAAWFYDGQETQLSDILEAYQFWPFWIFFGVVLLIQAALLFVPVKIATQAPQPKRHIWISAAATALAFSVVLVGIIWSIVVAIFGDDLLSNYFLLGSLAFIVINWLVWSFIFYRFARNLDPKAYIHRLTSWLLRGSILELLVAVPSHIIVRRREDCCTPGLTFIGMATGLVIMALAFGPGLFFLFRDRLEKSKPASKRKNPLNSHQLQ